ncbi:MAG: lipid II:glycine glycyltransferase FemX [Planctomycetota bacterium]|jgi:hypothetical protein
MQNSTQILDPLSCENWDERLARHEKINFFHSRAWARVLYETYGYQPMYFGSLNSGSMKTLLPLMEIKSILTGKRGVSLPFTDYCEPIFENGTDFDQLLQSAQQHGKQSRWQWIQVRGGDGIDAEPDQQYCVHELKLESDTENLFSRLRSSKRRNIRKAQSEKIQIIHSQDNEAVDAYYRLHCQTRKRHGVPPQPYRFFHKIFEHVISKGQGKVVLALHQKKMVAGSIYFHFRQKALYKFGASDMSFQHLRANDLVMWEAIKGYAAEGCQSFCFGRTALHNTGLRRFKSDWGAAERIINYYKYDLRHDDFVTTQPSENRLQQRIFQLLPVPALKLCGSALYRHMG